MKKTLSKALSLTLAVLMVIGLLAGCGGSAASNGGGDQTSALPSCASLKVGEDNTDLKADLKVITHRTDLMEDGTLDGYIAEFQKLYPNISIQYEGITNYASDMTTRLTSNDWGDICMIPTSIPLTELLFILPPWWRWFPSSPAS